MGDGIDRDIGGDNTISPQAYPSTALGYIMVDGLGGIHTTSPTGPLDLGYDIKPIAFSKDLVRGLALAPLQNGFWVLDAHGRLHGYGAAEDGWKINGGTELNFGWDIARDVEAGADGQGAFVLDGFGAVHPLGTAKSAGFLVLPRPYFGWDIVRNFEVSPDMGGYVMLDGFGGVHFIGNAADLYDPGELSPYFGWDIAKDIEVLPDGRKGYYLLDGFGGVHARGDADFLPTAYFGWDIGKDIELLPFGDLAGDPLHQGYALWQLEGYGGIHPTPDIEHEITTNMVRFSLIHYFGWDIAKDFEVVTAPPETQ